MIVATAWIVAVSRVGQADPAKLFLAGGACHMLAANLMLDDSIAMDAGSELRSTVLFCLVSIARIDEIELACPRSFTHKIIQKLALLIPTEVLA